MGGNSNSDTQTTQAQSSTTAPWGPTQDLLQKIIGGLGNQFGNVNPTGAETGALNTIQQNAQNTPNYGQQATDFTNQLFNGGTDRTGMVSDAYKQYQSQLKPIANQNNDPMQTPGMQGILDQIRNDVGNSVNGMFAGAGRDMSGMNQQTLARGIAQGEAAPLLGQYNQNVQNQMGAAGNLFGAGGATAGLLSGLDQTALGNKMQGFNAMQQIPGAMNNGANATLQAGQLSRGLPLQNLGQLMSLILPIAGMGSQSSGTSTGTSHTSQQASPLQQAMGISGMFKNFGFGFGGQ